MSTMFEGDVEIWSFLMVEYTTSDVSHTFKTITIFENCKEGTEKKNVHLENNYELR